MRGHEGAGVHDGAGGKSTVHNAESKGILGVVACARRHDGACGKSTVHEADTKIGAGTEVCGCALAL